MKKENIFTIPNLLTLLRFILIVPIVASILKQKFLLAFIFVALSALTDVVDGIIARKFHQVSDLGKIIDPIADKMTQCALILCLTRRHPSMLFMIVSFVIREGVVGFFSLYTFRKTKKVTSARWYGKINTVIIYGVMAILLLFPTLSHSVANTMIWFSTILMQLSLIGYTLYYIHTLQNYEKENT